MNEKLINLPNGWEWSNIAAEIVENLEAALEQFREVLEGLEESQ